MKTRCVINFFAVTSFAVRTLKCAASALLLALFCSAAPAWALTPTEVAKLLASNGAAGATFGNSVALAGDTAVIGAPWDDYNGN